MESKELVEKNRLRVEKYRKDEEEERFLESFNDSLASREKEFMKPDRPEYPNIFIFGAPRSGTTLLSQVLAFCLDMLDAGGGYKGVFFNSPFILGIPTL